MSQDLSKNLILLYDGECNVCDKSVQFVLKRDKKDLFRFASLQSSFGQNVLKKHKKNLSDLDTMYLIENYATETEKLHKKSSAVLHVLKNLQFPWKILTIGLIIPTFLRDFLYTINAKYRYSLWGKRDACRILTPDIKHKFLDL